MQLWAESGWVGAFVVQAVARWLVSHDWARLLLPRTHDGPAELPRAPALPESAKPSAAALQARSDPRYEFLLSGIILLGSSLLLLLLFLLLRLAL